MITLSFDAFNGSEQVFSDLRAHLAEKAGLHWDGFHIWAGAFVGTDDRILIEGEWPEDTPFDPLMRLLWHADHDGRWPSDTCGDIANRLEGMLEHVDGYWKADVQRLVDGFRKAVQFNTSMEIH